MCWEEVKDGNKFTRMADMERTHPFAPATSWICMKQLQAEEGVGQSYSCWGAKLLMGWRG